MEAYVQGKRIILDDKQALYGGEARVFLHQGQAIKIYHFGFMNPIKESKLKSFPNNLPKNLVSPGELVFDKKGNVIGFAMEVVKDAESFIMLSNKKFRENFSHEKTAKIFLSTLETLKKIHMAPMIVGDLNDLNLLFRDEEIFFIDADSMQFGKFPCEVATEQFLDPKLYGINFSLRPVFSQESDFYAFAVLLFKSLLFVNPYGGVHLKFPTFIKRAEKRVTVFDPEVKYPKAATHFKVLPDDMLQYFHQVFEKDLRGEFPKELIENLRWTKCVACQEVHAKNICPHCAHQAPAAIKPVAMVNRKCVAKIVFKTSGRIILTKIENGKIKFVYAESGLLKRENGEIVLSSNPDNFTRFGIMGAKTLIGKRNKLVVCEKGKVIKETSTGMLGNMPVFESSDIDFFRFHGDLLVKNDSRIIGEVLDNQTWMRIGEKFGFGFYRIGLKTVYFMFDLNSPGLNDAITLPKIEGQLIDAEAVFSSTHVLFLTSTMENGKLFNSMHLIDSRGTLVASKKDEANNSRILSQIHNKALGGDKIITATDDGLVLLIAENGNIREAKIFTDTEPFVDESLQVFTAQEGIYVVSEKDVKLLKLV
jgi:hypothetical protein